MTESRELYDHQKKALEFLSPEGGYLAFEQGLGKTLTAIRYAEKHWATRVLVVCPAVAIGVWENELLEAGHAPLIPQGTRKEKAEFIAGSGGGYLVLNYEALIELAVERAVSKWMPDLIIIDEAQKIKTATAKRSKVLHRLGKDTTVLALSGTPITKNLLDLYSQYKTIDPDIWGGVSWTRFKQRYGVWGGYGGYELVGYQNQDELLKKIEPYTLVARKEDTLDLPSKTHVTVPVPLDPASWRDYVAMARDGVARDWVTATPLEKALRLSQITGEAKVEATVDFVNGIVDGDDSVVVYFRFLKDGERLSDLLGVPALTGGTGALARTRMVEDFQAGRLPIFLSQITAGSTAITLTRASHMVYHSLSYAYEDWAQSQDRIHRIGQYHPCTYYYMVSTGPKHGISIDTLVLNVLESKGDVASVVTHNPDLLLVKETE